ncbi:MAG TPA: glycine cleavage system aminomethyltransferase GcvT [Clostridiales bacterium]|nr:glycine cleavage system aminomethyltransferase GcvT [Clostridiales bacterium]
MSMKTPLYDLHVALGGQMVDFAGYELPIQYKTGIVVEHNAVRNNAGIFDVSHMGEIFFEGKEAEKALNYVMTNNMSNMYDGQCRYSMVCYENGGVVDDVLVYKFNDEKFLVVANASNKDKDFKWFLDNTKNFDVKVRDQSPLFGQIALQGPKSFEILEKILDTNTLPQKYYSFKENVDILGVKCLVSKTGYTGEDGYEIYCPAGETEKIYKTLLENGKDFGLIPTGLGARDTLRLEAGMPLYGHELSDKIMANEVNLDFVLKFNKEDFIGKTALENHTPEYERVGAIVVDRGIVREGAEVYFNDDLVGVVTSGTFIPSLQKAVCVLRLKIGYKDKPLTAKVRNRNLKLEVVDMPFMKKKK